MKYGEGDYEVKFLRYRKCNTFVEPPVDDIASVNNIDIKMLLENPSVAQGTQKQKGLISFEIETDFSNLITLPPTQYTVGMVSISLGPHMMWDKN